MANRDPWPGYSNPDLPSYLEVFLAAEVTEDLYRAARPAILWRLLMEGLPLGDLRRFERDPEVLAADVVAARLPDPVALAEFTRLARPLRRRYRLRPWKGQPPLERLLADMPPAVAGG